MLQRIDLGRALVALGSLLLLVSLFLDWYDIGGTGWEVFEALDLLLAALAIGAIMAALRDPDGTHPLLRYAPFAALAVVMVQLVNPPPVLQLAGDALNVQGASDPDTGAWMALAGCALMAAGAVLAIARVSVTIDLAERTATAESPGDGEDADEPATSVAPAAPAPPEPPRRSPSLLGDRATPQAPVKGGPLADPEAHPAAPLKPGPATREPLPDPVREVPAIDHRHGKTAPPDEPDPTQPLRVAPDDETP